MRRGEFTALAAGAILGAAQPDDLTTSTSTSTSTPEPLTLPSFADAVASIDATIARDRIDPLVAVTGLPRFYRHARATENAVVLYHGFTNVPQQFDELARRFYDRGCNVYVPRIPLHGYRDRLTRALGALTNAQLAMAATESYRVARGLGRRITVVGLSLGGTMALYLALTQAIDHAVPVSPFLVPIGVPGWLGVPAMTAVAWLPDFYVWWDPRIKERCLPLYAYPGFPSHALAACVFFGDTVVRAAAEHRTPLARRLTLVTNATESAVNNSVANRLLDEWNAAGTTGGC